jgi:hypothetical protein
MLGLLAVILTHPCLTSAMNTIGIESFIAVGVMASSQSISYLCALSLVQDLALILLSYFSTRNIWFANSQCFSVAVISIQCTVLVFDL